MIARFFPILALLVLLDSGFGFAQKIYQADSPEEASVKVFAVDDPSQADLFVFFVYEPQEVTKTGLWMDMRFPHEADVIIFFVDEEKDCDLKIWLVDTIDESKWINESKKHLLSIKTPAKQ